MLDDLGYMGEGWWFQTDMGWKYAQNIGSDGQPRSQRRVVEVWIVDILAEAVRSLSYQQGWMQPYIYEWPSHKSATLLWSKWTQLEWFISLNSGKPGTPPKRIQSTSNFKNGQVLTLIHKESAWLGIRAWLTALCHPQRPQLDKKPLHVATWRQVQKTPVWQKNGPDIILFWWVLKRRPNSSHDVLKMSSESLGCFFGYVFVQPHLSQFFRHFLKCFAPNQPSYPNYFNECQNQP